jgi:hypothetical protein
MLIKLKPIYISSLIKFVFGIGILCAIALFIMMSSDLIMAFSLSLILTSSGVFYAFYLNKNELLTLKIIERNIELSFINNFIFKRNDMTLPIDDLTIVLKKDILNLTHQGKIIAIVRKKSITESEWKELLLQLKVHA